MNTRIFFRIGIIFPVIAVIVCTRLCMQSSQWVNPDAFYGFGTGYAVISLCPIVYFFLVKHINVGEKIGLVPFFCDFAVFNIIVAGSTYIIQEILFYQPYFSADSVSEMYMYISGIYTFFVFRLMQEKPSKREIILCAVLIAVTLLLWVFWCQRPREILASLSLPFQSRDVEGEFVNWFSLRRHMMKLSVTGELSGLSHHFANEIMEFCPLARFRYMGNGLYTAILLGAIIIHNIVMIIYGAKSKSPLIRTLTFSFVSRAAAGVLANLFLVFSTCVTIPFTVTPYDIVPLGILIAAKPGNI